MSIVRHQPAKILSGAVEANGMVYVAGTVADRRPAPVKAQTEEILGRNDALSVVVFCAALAAGTLELDWRKLSVH